MTRVPLPTLLLCLIGFVGLRPTPGMAEPLASLAALEQQFLASFQTKIEDGHQRRVSELDGLAWYSYFSIRCLQFAVPIFPIPIA